LQEPQSIEPIALQVEGGKVRSLQKFVTNAVWDDARMLRKYHTLLKEDLGCAPGFLIFLWHLKIKLGGGKAPHITLSQLRILLEVVLPLRVYDIESALLLVEGIQQRNHLAYLSHKRRKKRKMTN